jgi:PhnB protein
MADVKPVPEGYHTVTPSLIVGDAAGALEFYKRALGAEEIFRMTSPDGASVVHAEMRIGDSVIFLSDECPDSNYRSPQTLSGNSVGFYLYVEDADASFDKAIAAGSTSVRPMQDMFWGDRLGTVVDPYGHQWTFSTHVRDVSPEEMAEASQAFFNQAEGVAS